MNYTTAVFLINTSVRAIMCAYEAGDKAGRTMFKTLDKTIREGDFVIVPTDTRHNMTVVKVVAVDVDVDFDCPAAVAWVVDKVDTSGYQTTLDQEAEAVTVIKSAEKTKKRNELRDAIMADVVELKALPITGIVPSAATAQSNQ